MVYTPLSSAGQCCFEGVCYPTNQKQCTTLGGEYYNSNEECEKNCIGGNFGACCYSEGENPAFCLDNISSNHCIGHEFCPQGDCEFYGGQECSEIEWSCWGDVDSEGLCCYTEHQSPVSRSAKVRCKGSSFSKCNNCDPFGLGQEMNNCVWHEGWNEQQHCISGYGCPRMWETTRPCIPDSHPGSCNPDVLGACDMDTEDKIRHFAGIYKFSTLRNVGRNDLRNECGGWKLPSVFGEGWMIAKWNQHHPDPEDATYDNIGEFYISGIESQPHNQSACQTYSQNTRFGPPDDICRCWTEWTPHYPPCPNHKCGWPNTNDGGCGRLFGPSNNEDSNTIGSYLRTLTEVAPTGTILITPVNVHHSGSSWAKWSYSNVYGPIIGSTNLRFTGLRYIEGSDPSNDAIFKMKTSSRCEDSTVAGACCNDDKGVLGWPHPYGPLEPEDPHYYYVWFEEAWNNAPTTSRSTERNTSKSPGNQLKSQLGSNIPKKKQPRKSNKNSQYQWEKWLKDNE